MRQLKKIKDITVYKDENYCSFPNAIVLNDGTIMVGFRQAPDWQERYNDITHGDPSSIGVFVKSSDNGETWTLKPELIYRHYYYGVQDPCINYLSDGTILGTFFMWKFTEKDSPVTDAVKPHFVNDNYDMEMMDSHSTRSYDNGQTWDNPICVEYEGKNEQRSSVRGNVIELDDGCLILALTTYDKTFDKRFIIILKSCNQGITWEKINDIIHPNGYFMGEPNLFRTETGKIVCLLRTHIPNETRNVYDDGNSDMSPMHFCVSYDNGNTWSDPEKTKFTSPSPFHALQLSSGNILVTYGHRYSPYGIKAFLVDGEFENIHTAEEILIRDDGVNHDLGYTSSVQMPNGDILVTYYIFHENDTTRYIAGTILREETQELT